MEPDVFSTIDRMRRDRIATSRGIARRRQCRRRCRLSAWDDRLQLVDIEVFVQGPPRPLTARERDAVEADKKAIPKDPECTTVPQYLDAATLMLTAQLADAQIEDSSVAVRDAGLRRAPVRHLRAGRDRGRARSPAATSSAITKACCDRPCDCASLTTSLLSRHYHWMWRSDRVGQVMDIVDLATSRRDPHQAAAMLAEAFSHEQRLADDRARPGGDRVDREGRVRARRTRAAARCWAGLAACRSIAAGSGSSIRSSCSTRGGCTGWGGCSSRRSRTRRAGAAD